MTHILLVADEPWVANEVESALADDRFTVSHTDESDAVAAIAATVEADLVVADMQVGSRGGMAIARTVRDAVATGDLSPTPVILLLDRKADEFLARRAGADAWVVKPFNSFELRDLVERFSPTEVAET